MNFLTGKICLVLCVFFTGVVNANLIVNGGFEETEVKYKTWKWFSSSDVLGWEGSNIEIWDHLGNFKPYEGEQHAELNAHPSNGEAFSIFQAFSTDIGSVYDLSFAYSARQSTNEQFRVELISDSSSFFSELVNHSAVREWALYEEEFTAVSSQTILMFNSVKPYSGTLGNFLDDIIVTAKRIPATSTQVSEPNGILLFSLMLVSMIRFVRVNRK
jgi:hypothetical protein